ncbi:MAG: hypothetical protein HYY26_03215 [Acidobacteria bacterium]|nr:hypothetical protein [Acidobacteriota bacterium]
MKIWLVALNTYRGLLRHRALLAFILLFLFTLISSLAGLYFASRLAEGGAGEQSRQMFARQIEGLTQTFAIYAFVLAALTAAYLLPGEIRTGTIVPTLGRALSRSQFLLGLFLGMNLLLASYLAMAGAILGGLVLWSGLPPAAHLAWGVLYLVLIANIVGAIAFFFAMRLSPLVAVVALLLWISLPSAAGAVRLYSQLWGERLEAAASRLLPAWDLLEFDQFLRLTQAPTGRGAEFFLVGITHGLDYILIFLLLALLAFRRRSLLSPN